MHGAFAAAGAFAGPRAVCTGAFAGTGVYAQAPLHTQEKGRRSGLGRAVEECPGGAGWGGGGVDGAGRSEGGALRGRGAAAGGGALTGRGMAEGRPAPDGWRTEPALPHRGCPCPASRRSGHGATVSPGGVTSPGGSERWGGWRSLPPESGGRSLYQAARLGACIRSGGEERRQGPPVRTLRNTHPSGGRPAAEGCDEGARSGLVPRARGAAVRRSPPPVRPPAVFRTADAATPCPWAGNPRSQRSHRRCRKLRWSRSSQSSLS